MDSLGRIRVITHPDVSDIFPPTRKVGEKKVFSLTSYFLHFPFCDTKYWCYSILIGLIGWCDNSLPWSGRFINFLPTQQYSILTQDLLEELKLLIEWTFV